MAVCGVLAHVLPVAGEALVLADLLDARPPDGPGEPDSGDPGLRVNIAGHHDNADPSVPPGKPASRNYPQADASQLKRGINRHMQRVSS